jgi:putative NADPH-quinone reductase
MMKIVIVNSSPKMGKGNTHVIAEAFSRGAISAGAEVENIFLAKYTIKPCAACLSCWFKTPGKCVLNDDAEMILNRIAEAELLIFATPLYVDNVSGIMKLLMDRMISKGNPLIEIDKNGETRHVVKKSKLTKIGVISNCGFPEQDQFQVLRLLFRRIARNMNVELAVDICRGEGTLLTVEGAQLKPIVDQYKKLVEKAGNETVTLGKITQETLIELAKPLIPYEVYNKAVNEIIMKELQHKSD